MANSNHIKGFRKQWVTVLLPVVLSILLVITGCASGQGKAENAEGHIKIASKGFGEQDILANMVKILLDKKTKLSTEIVTLNNDLLYTAIKEGTIDTYVEYTGTALINILKADPVYTSDEAYTTIKTGLKEQYHIAVLDKLGFNNSTVFAMKEEKAAELGITTFSQVAEQSENLRLSASQVFLTRPDSYPAVEKIYAPKFKEIVTMDVGLNQKALEDGLVDVIYTSMTSGKIRVSGLRLIEDDKHAFVPYDAVPFVRESVLASHPEVADIYQLLTGKLDNTIMQQLNEKVDIDSETPERVAEGWLKEQGLID
jgi:glycine betaine/choline ABC-type transport system substrate-binding protein